MSIKLFEDVIPDDVEQTPANNLNLEIIPDPAVSGKDIFININGLENISNQNININIYDILGNQIYSNENADELHPEGGVHLGNISAGVYFMSVEIKGIKKVRKFVIAGD